MMAGPAIAAAPAAADAPARKCLRVMVMVLSLLSILGVQGSYPVRAMSAYALRAVPRLCTSGYWIRALRPPVDRRMVRPSDRRAAPKKW